MGIAQTLDFVGSSIAVTDQGNGVMRVMSNVGGSAVTEFEFIIDGGGSTITLGQKGFFEVPFAMTITGWTLVADQSGSIVVDVWKQGYAGFPPNSGNSITGADTPTLSSAVKNQNNAVTLWTTSLAAGDILAYNVNSVTTVQRVTLSIRGTKN